MQWSFLHLTLSSTSWAMAFSARPCHVKAFPYATTLFTGFQPWLPITASNHTQPRSYNILCKLCILIRNLSYVLSPQALVEHFNLIISPGISPGSATIPTRSMGALRSAIPAGRRRGCGLRSRRCSKSFERWKIPWLTGYEMDHIYYNLYIYIYTDRYVYALYLGDWGLS